MGVRRANIGAERYVSGWDNFDIVGGPGMHVWDIRSPWGVEKPDYDYAVMNHVLNHLDHHELVPALANVRKILRPYGVLRVMVPDLLRAMREYEAEHREWFPQDERIEGIDAALCTYITWFGTQKSVFTPVYLYGLLSAAGFRWIEWVSHDETCCPHDGITGLDDRLDESLFFEARA